MNMFNTLRLRQNGRIFPDDPFQRIFLKENVRIVFIISLKFVSNGPINNIPALVQTESETICILVVVSGSDNGLVLSRQQAIIQTNDG